MDENNSWHLIARDNSNQGKPAAYAHFRYDMDYDDEVLYVYEIQLEPEYKRKGLGRFMMQVRGKKWIFKQRSQTFFVPGP